MNKDTYRRIFEILPGLMTWTTLIGLFVLAIIKPVWVDIFVIVLLLYLAIRVVYLTTLLVVAYRRLAKEKKISFTTDITPDPIYFQGEKWKVEQAVSNLIDNAIRYNRPSGSLTVSLGKNRSHAEIIIKDTGIGISDEDKTKIFDRFYRGERSRSRYSGGFGLGLSIVKSIVESYSGTIIVSSQLEKGSIFTVQLPI